MLGQQTTPLLGLLRKLEAQNIWRMSYNILGQQQQYSAAAAAAPAAGARTAEKPAGGGAAAGRARPSMLHRRLPVAACSVACRVLQFRAPAAACGRAPGPTRPKTPTFASCPLRPATEPAADWVDNPAVSAQEAVKILVHQIQQSGPISERPLALGLPARLGSSHDCRLAHLAHRSCASCTCQPPPR